MSRLPGAHRRVGLILVLLVVATALSAPANAQDVPTALDMGFGTEITSSAEIPIYVGLLHEETITANGQDWEILSIVWPPGHTYIHLYLEPSGGGGTGGSNRFFMRLDLAGFFDQNANGKLDSWRDIVATKDRCANNFDLNDRLGADEGGINTQRRDHRGVDVQADIGDSVFSMKSGIIVDKATSPTGVGCGTETRVDHDDGSWAIYCHLREDSHDFYELGQRVEAGHIVGLVGRTGNSKGPHVHVSYSHRGDENSRDEYFDYVDRKPKDRHKNRNGC